MKLGQRVFRFLLRFLPGEFRGDFGDAMMRDASAADQGGAFWWRECGGLLSAIVRENLDVLRQDLKYALRTMRRTPGFTAMAVVMLALGTGVNVAVFSIVDAVLLKSPFVDATQLVYVRGIVNGKTAAISLERYRELEAAPGPLAAVAAQGGGSHVLTGQGDPRNVDDIECVSASMFGVLGTSPLIGRTFGADEDRAGAAPTIVLSFRTWRELGGSPDVVGSTITLNQAPVTVVGVMPDGFAGPLARSDVQGWMPLSRPVRSADNAGCRQSKTVSVIGRVKSGLTRIAIASAVPGLRFDPLESPILDEVQTPLQVLSAAVACVLLIACFNVGGLQMERTLSRRREMAVRLSLGASRGRLMRQALTENLLLALIGAGAGVAAAQLALRGMVSMLPANVPYIDQVAINGRVLSVAMLSAIVAGLIAAILPAAQARRVSPARDLTDATRASERRGSWGRRVLVVAEIALSIVVLIGAALMIQTFMTLRPSHPGFDPANKMVMNVRLRGVTDAAGVQFFDHLLGRLRSTPGVQGAEGTTYFPMRGVVDFAEVIINGVPKSTWTTTVTPGYFSLVKIPLARGRFFQGTDEAGAAPVMIVNETLARRLSPDGQVVGRRVAVELEEGAAAGQKLERTIVGIVGNTRSSGVHTGERAEAYVPYAQNAMAGLTIIAGFERSRGAETALGMRAAVRALQPDLVVEAPRSMTALISDRMGSTPFGALLLGVLAALAVGLSGIGLMATIGWWVRQRTREIGVRIALGASARGVVGMVFRQGLTLAVLGIGIGASAAAALTRYLTGWIYGVTPLDPATFAGCAGLMLGVAMIALFFPTRRASRVDPVVALRAE